MGLIIYFLTNPKMKKIPSRWLGPAIWCMDFVLGSSASSVSTIKFKKIDMQVIWYISLEKIVNGFSNYVLNWVYPLINVTVNQFFVL